MLQLLIGRDYLVLQSITMHGLKQSFVTLVVSEWGTLLNTPPTFLHGRGRMSDTNLPLPAHCPGEDPQQLPVCTARATDTG